MRKELVLLFTLISTPIVAQVRVPPLRTVATLGTCTDAQPKIVAVSDGSTASDCSAGSGAFDVTCECKDGAWRAVLGGSTGATDNALLRADGTGGATAQASGLIVDDVAANVCTAHTAAGVALAFAATAPTATTGASQAGKAASLTASNATASTDTAGAAAGGSVTITAGNAARFTSGNANGGDVLLYPGAGVGSGSRGDVVLVGATNVSGGSVKIGSAASGDNTFGVPLFFPNTGSSSYGLQTRGGVLRWVGSPVVGQDNGGYVAIEPSGVFVGADGHIGFSSVSNNALSSIGDTVLHREAKAVLAQYAYNSYPNAVRLYALRDDASNYERLTLTETAGSSVTLAAETAGTGADNLNIVLSPAGTSQVKIGSSGGGFRYSGVSGITEITDGSGNGGKLYSGSSSTALYGGGGGLSVGAAGLGFSTANSANLNLLTYSSGTIVRSGDQIGWSSHATNANGGASDTGLSRPRAGIVKVTNGSTGAGTLQLAPLASPPETCDGTAEGDIYSDTSHALCWCDGTTWTKLAGSGTCA